VRCFVVNARKVMCVVVVVVGGWRLVVLVEVQAGVACAWWRVGCWGEPGVGLLVEKEAGFQVGGT
jgi:hypothetical protein